MAIHVGYRSVKRIGQWKGYHFYGWSVKRVPFLWWLVKRVAKNILVSEKGPFFTLQDGRSVIRAGISHAPNLTLGCDIWWPVWGWQHMKAYKWDIPQKMVWTCSEDGGWKLGEGCQAHQHWRKKTRGKTQQQMERIYTYTHHLKDTADVAQNTLLWRKIIQAENPAD